MKKINVYKNTMKNGWKACENRKTIKTGETLEEMANFVQEKETEGYKVKVNFIW